MPGHTPTGNENTVWGFAGTDFAEDTQVVLAFAVRQKKIIESVLAVFKILKYIIDNPLFPVFLRVWPIGEEILWQLI